MDYTRITRFSFAPVIYARIVVFRMMMDFRSCDEVLFSGAGLWLLLVLSHFKSDLSGTMQKRKGQQKKPNFRNSRKTKVKSFQTYQQKPISFGFFPSDCSIRLAANFVATALLTIHSKTDTRGIYVLIITIRGNRKSCFGSDCSP